MYTDRPPTQPTHNANAHQASSSGGTSLTLAPRAITWGGGSTATRWPRPPRGMTEEGARKGRKDRCWWRAGARTARCWCGTRGKGRRRWRRCGACGDASVPCLISMRTIRRSPSQRKPLPLPQWSRRHRLLRRLLPGAPAPPRLRVRRRLRAPVGRPGQRRGG